MNKKPKNIRARKVLVGLIVLCMLLYSGFWLAYYLSMQGVNARAKVSRCEEGKGLAFEGIISRINRYEYSSFMQENYFGLDIKTDDTTNKFITWQFTLQENKDLLNKISVGQGIRKVKGFKTFTLSVTKTVKKEFAVPYCDPD